MTTQTRMQTDDAFFLEILVMSDKLLAMSDKIGARIKEAREIAGLSQMDVTVKTGISPTSLSRYESGRVAPSASKVADIAKATGQDAHWILTGEKRSADAGETPTRPIPPGLAEFLASDYAQQYVPPEAAAILKRLRAAEGDKVYEWRPERWEAMWYAMKGEFT